MARALRDSRNWDAAHSLGSCGARTVRPMRYIKVIPCGHPAWRTVVLTDEHGTRPLATCETASAWQLAVEVIADAAAEGIDLRLVHSGLEI